MLQLSESKTSAWRKVQAAYCRRDLTCAFSAAGRRHQKRSDAIIAYVGPFRRNQHGQAALRDNPHRGMASDSAFRDRKRRLELIMFAPGCAASASRISGCPFWV